MTYAVARRGSVDQGDVSQALFRNLSATDVVVDLNGLSSVRGVGSVMNGCHA